jgi:ArsR family transcriptional regulator
VQPEASSTFEALADATRREILAILADGELTATDVANRIKHVGRTAVSSHLRILRTAGLVNERREGRFRWYSVNPVAAADIVEFLGTVYRSTLADLKAATEAADAVARATDYRHADGS